MSFKVLFDNRWPVGTGIRRMVDLYLSYAPGDFAFESLNCSSRIGSPFSFFSVSTALKRQVKNVGRELFWNPGFIPPLPGLIKSVVTVHDLTHLHFYSNFHRMYYDNIFKPLYRRCDHILCVSEYTRNEFLDWSGISSERVTVLSNAIDPAFHTVSDAIKVDRPFIFYAGNRRNYKNVGLLLQAYVCSGLASDGVDLILTGNFDPYLKEFATAAGVGDSLKFTGFLDDKNLVAYYKAARCFAFLSAYEGFGLPILEAMACDTPLLLARKSSLPEVAADAALYVDLNNIEEIAAGLRTLCFDEVIRSRLVDKGRIRREFYRADVSAAKLWKIIRDI